MNGQPALVFLVVATCLSGCLSTHSSADRPLHAFRAIYKADGGAINVSFDGPIKVADRDFTVRTAYALDVDFGAGAMHDGERESPESHFRYWLDKELLVVRVEHLCPERMDDGLCQPLSYVAWRSQGAPPPLGLFWPRLQDRTSLPIQGGLQPWNRTWTQTAQGFESRQSIAMGEFLDLTGPMQWTRNSDLPQHFEGNIHSSAARFTVTADLAHVEYGPELPAADAWPKAIFVGHALEHPALLFEGEDDPIPTRSFSVKDAYGHLRDLSADAKTMLDSGGCVVGVDVMPLSGWSGGNVSPLPLSIHQLDTNASRIKFILRNGDSLRHFEVEYEFRGAQPEQWAAREVSMGRRDFVSCDQRSSVAPLTSLPDFMRLVGGLPIDGHPPLEVYGIAWLARSQLSRSLGPISYYAAPWDVRANTDGFTVTNQVYFEAGPGWWEHVVLPPSTMARLDGSAPG
jgi:hypothetical protein